MDIVRGEIYYFLKGDYARWGKVYDIDDTHVYCIISDDVRDLDPVPVNNRSDFMEEVLVTNGSYAPFCRMDEAADYLGYGSEKEMLECIKEDFGGNRESFFKYGHNLVISEEPKQKILIKGFSSSYYCKFRTDWIELGSLDNVIHVDEMRDKYNYLTLIDGRVCMPPRDKMTRRKFIMDMLLK